MQIDYIFEDKKLKQTTARKELMKLLSLEKGPVSFEDIKDKINMDKATFYRNISRFEEESMVNSFESNDKKRYYEIKASAHAHFICNSCNKIECLKDSSFIKIDGYTVTDAIFKGICKDCNNS